MKKQLVPIIMLFVTFIANGQSAENSSYDFYSVTKKELTMFEWRLVQANLKLGETGYFVYFDHNDKSF